MLTLLKRLVKNEYLYTEEKIKEVKSQIRILEEEISAMEAKNSKAFEPPTDYDELYDDDDGYPD